MKDNSNLNFYKTTLDCDDSDIIYKQHMHSVGKLNAILIAIQCMLLILSLILRFKFSVNISIQVAYVNVLILAIVMLNIDVHNKTWAKAKYDLRINWARRDIIYDEDLREDEVMAHLSMIKGAHSYIKGEKYLALMYKWYNNFHTKKRKAIPYRDASGQQYHIGDLVLNPSFHDIWLVEELDAETQKQYDLDIPYVLTQYGDPDSYIMEIDKPAGFVIACTPDEPDKYIKLLVLFNKKYNQNIVLERGDTDATEAKEANK